MTITMNHKTFEKIGNKWTELDNETLEISQEVYERLENEKWKGDKREFNYTMLGYRMVKLTNIEPEYKQFKSVRTFEFN